MVVGTTHASVSLDEIFSKRSELDILSSYFSVKRLPCLISSPLRKDTHPSFCLYMDKLHRVRYIDYATNDHGNLIDFLCQYWRCTFAQAVTRIYDDITNATGLHIQPSQRGRRITVSSTEFEVKVRPWEAHDLDYWASYGITPEYLAYAEIYPISHKVVTKKDDNGKTSKSVFKADKYAYVFVERKEGKLSLKIYQPYNTRGFKWNSKMDRSVISLWTKIPEKGERVVICSSLKDALCVSCQLGIPAVALQGEGYSMSRTAIENLKGRYDRIYISFDTDEAGIRDSRRLASRTGFTNVIPDLGKEKDFSDYYKSLSDKTEFQKLKQLFT